MPSLRTLARTAGLPTLLAACAACAAFAGAVAQDPRPGADLPTDGNAPLLMRKIGLVAVPVIRSTPALGTGAGLVVSVPFHTDSISPASTVGGGGVYTDSHSWMVGLGAVANAARGHLHASGGVAAFDLHYRFFGIGTDAGNEDQWVRLKQRGNSEVIEGLYRFANSFAIGPRYRFSSMTTALDQETPPVARADEIAGVQSPMASSGFGAAAEFDSRDDQDEPRKGTVGRATATFARGEFGSDVSYNAYEAWISHYASIHQRHVFAARLYGCSAGHDAPFWDLCLYGANTDLRGYTGGRYRDHAMLAGQAELRSDITSRIGSAVFAGVGEVASSMGAIAAKDLLPSAGVGVRFLALKKNRLKLGADYAIGKNGGAFYLRIGEAF